MIPFGIIAYFTIHEIKMKEPGVMRTGIGDATPPRRALTGMRETH